MKLLHIENKLAELFRMKSRKRTATLKRPKSKESPKLPAKEASSRPPK